MFRVVIPARFGSTRLPGKPLAHLAGTPMILHVHRLAQRSGAQEVVVATDDERVRAVCMEAGADVEMTSPRHPSGTDRIAELAARRGWSGDSVVVNVQADEPMLPPALIRQAAELLERDSGAAIATLAAPVESLEEYLDPNVVKLVTQSDGRALYFSRAPIPWHRDGATAGLASQTRFRGARRHLGIYAYRVDALARLAAAPPLALERAERLEQLRALQMGLPIVVGDAQARPGPGVDTADDLAHVERLLREGRRP
ncbi:MAG: 3-deoxy-manno-octulosonate cytidylyltransferase [Gammaproteobacteria bacterium]